MAKEETPAVPEPQPVAARDLNEAGVPEPQEAGSHRHDWRGFRMNRTRVQQCVQCGKRREES